MNQSQQTIEPWLRGIIRCPQCKGEVIDATHAGDDAAAAAGASSAGTSVTELRCDTCHLAYPVENGVPVLLVDLARRTDS
ncbi:hypothetical protein GCM10009868_22410 [Terrabacter aerolatus]|uniref:Trm112 family protein n=1 Tax=Terrabacter aerolatus TaxID=422442 RepID=A0A512D1K1_9MICO|nr:Trm112 family protein [Terrabacter aerolatus]GEO30343.1 hypothetical protein TAE01_21530 [Terrabacter aerolatus]